MPTALALAFLLVPDEPTGVTSPGWHALTVRVLGQRGDVRTRSGYFRR